MNVFHSCLLDCVDELAFMWHGGIGRRFATRKGLSSYVALQSCNETMKSNIDEIAVFPVYKHHRMQDGHGLWLRATDTHMAAYLLWFKAFANYN